MMRHPYRSEIFALLEDRARALGYDASLSSLPGSGFRYAAETWLGQLRQSKQPKAKERAMGLALTGRLRALVAVSPLGVDLG